MKEDVCVLVQRNVEFWDAGVSYLKENEKA